jgi:pilus assembly protein CpaB
MRISSILIAVSGIAVAGGSVYAAREVITARTTVEVEVTEQTMVELIIANRNVALGQIIEPHLLSTISWPVASVPPGAFTDMTLLLPVQGGEPRRVRRAISEGELLLENRVSDFGEKVTIVQTLAEGHRAMAIEVNAETAVGGFVTPGDFVDIVMTHGRNETLRAVTILQNVRVIGVDQDSDERSDAPEIANTVTVEVSPEEGQRLALAQEAGTLSLSLRTEALVADLPLTAIRLQDILQEVSPVPREDAIPVVLVRRGNVLSVETQ